MNFYNEFDNLDTEEINEIKYLLVGCILYLTKFIIYLYVNKLI